MTPSPSSSAFALPSRLAEKADPALLAADEVQFAAIGSALSASLADLGARLDQTLRAPARDGQERVERDATARSLRTRLRRFSRFSLDACLGRTVAMDGTAPRYIGRIGIADEHGDPLLLDWRSPAAEPFFAATRAHPLHLVSRRRYRWSGGRVRDYVDETFPTPGRAEAAVTSLPTAPAAPDDDSEFLESLGEARTPRMRDVLATLAADQDAIIRADARAALVVDGGPGTGKTVVALHRAAYLLYADPRARRDGVLVVGPHRPYLRYVADVLPNLGEDDVRTCTLRDLVPEGAAAPVVEDDPRATALKADGRMLAAIEPAVALYEEPPTASLDVEMPWGSVRLAAQDWADAFAAVASGTPHNLARAQILDELAEIVLSRLDDEDLDVDRVRADLDRDREVIGTLHRAWPILDAPDLVADLWEVPAYLRRCTPWLDREESALLRRADPRAWTDADLPLLDAARHRLGDPGQERRHRRADAARARREEELSGVIDDLIASDQTEMLQMSMLRGEDLRGALVAATEGSDAEADDLSGPFAHVIVDEAQELTDAQWGMILRRCPSRSLTIVGDRAQSRRGFPESWTERLARVGLTSGVEVATLHLNYRTPSEIMREAEPVIRAVLPDANVPTSIRETGIAVRHAGLAALDGTVDGWLAAHPEGIVGVLAAADPDGDGAWRRDDRVQLLTPELAAGLEFDLVVLIDPETFGTGVDGAVARYVAMTRATRELVVLDEAGD